MTVINKKKISLLICSFYSPKSNDENMKKDKEKCKENEFRCRTSGRCIDRIFVCDHIVDCDYDQSDEDFCCRYL